MKNLFVLFAMLSASALAENEITDLKVCQRWPWSAKVDISCTYTGSETTSVVFTATWVGQTTPVELISLDADDACELKPGKNRFSWDPALAGYGNRAFADFNVTATVTNADPRTYLVVDLVKGGYSYLPTPPSGGWGDEYKLTNMVFRRIPKGVYELGTSEYGQFRAKWSGGQSGAIGRHWTQHQVTYTSDFYFQIFFMTGEQIGWIIDGKTWGGGTTPTKPSGMSYAAYRGSTLDDGTTAVYWPATGHRVNSTSIVGKFRALTAKQGQAELLVDLPTDQQWQLAMSAGANTFLPNGGLASDDQATLNAYFDELCWPKNDAINHPVGSKGCNRFGIYDFNVYPNPLLDWIEANGTVDGTNPYYLDRGDRIDFVGRSEPYADMPYRLMAGGYNDYSDLSSYRATVYMRFKLDPTATQTYIAPRFAINLKPLVK